MAVLSKEEFLKRIEERAGDANADEDLKFIEDMTDTYDNLVSLTKPEIDWERKYKENDAEWRKKYKERFFSASVPTPEPEPEPEPEPNDLTFDDLFV